VDGVIGWGGNAKEGARSSTHVLVALERAAPRAAPSSWRLSRAACASVTIGTLTTERVQRTRLWRTRHRAERETVLALALAPCFASTSDLHGDECEFCIFVSKLTNIVPEPRALY